MGGHALLWVLVPLLSLPNGHRDVLELLNWGKHPRWGYWKHPPLSSWVGEAVLRLTGPRLWGIYVAAQVGLSICFWAVWRLARDVLSPAGALASVLVLEGVFYFNYTSPKFNHDALQPPLWALLALAAWRALTRDRLGAWIAVGAVAGLGLLSKYSIAFLLLPLGVFVLLEPGARRRLGRPGPWLALGVAGCLVAPHVAWLAAHGFPTLSYGLERAARRGALADRLWNPLDFALNHALTLLPAGILLGSLRGAPARARAVAPGPDAFARRYVALVALGPFVTYLAVSALTGWRLLAGWGTPLWAFVGILGLLTLRPVLTPALLRRLGGLVLALAVVWAGVFVGVFRLGPALTGRVRPEHFPGRAVAEVVTGAWQARVGRPLAIVAGDRSLADSVGFYSTDRPDVYDLDDSDPLKSPGVDDATLRRRGGVLVWNARLAGAALPAAWAARFPGARAEPVVSFRWQTGAAVPPVEMGWAILPPAAPP